MRDPVTAVHNVLITSQPRTGCTASPAGASRGNRVPAALPGTGTSSPGELPPGELASELGGLPLAAREGRDPTATR